MKGIQHGIEQHNQFYKEMKLSPKGKTNFLEDEFALPKEKVVERPTHPWDRFIVSRENDAGKFRECFSITEPFSPRSKFTPPKGRFFSSIEKIADNFTSPREKT